jgi:hypothetical protein
MKSYIDDLYPDFKTIGKTLLYIVLVEPIWTIMLVKKIFLG